MALPTWKCFTLCYDVIKEEWCDWLRNQILDPTLCSTSLLGVVSTQARRDVDIDTIMHFLNCIVDN